MRWRDVACGRDDGWRHHTREDATPTEPLLEANRRHFSRRCTQTHTCTGIDHIPVRKLKPTTTLIHPPRMHASHPSHRNEHEHTNQHTCWDPVSPCSHPPCRHCVSSCSSSTKEGHAASSLVHLLGGRRGKSRCTCTWVRHGPSSCRTYLCMYRLHTLETHRHTQPLPMSIFLQTAYTRYTPTNLGGDLSRPKRRLLNSTAGAARSARLCRQMRKGKTT